MRDEESVFVEIMKRFLARDPNNSRLLAEEFQVAVSTTEQWARGTARPHHALRRQIVSWMRKQSGKRGMWLGSRVVLENQTTVESLEPYITRIITALNEYFGVEVAFVSDASCFSDFFEAFRDKTDDPKIYRELGEKIGIPLDYANADDHVIMKVARRLKLQEKSS